MSQVYVPGKLLIPGGSLTGVEKPLVSTPLGADLDGNFTVPGLFTALLPHGTFLSLENQAIADVVAYINSL